MTITTEVTFLLKLHVNSIILMWYQLIAKGVLEEIPFKAT